MHTQEIFIIEPNSPEQASALKAFVEALKMKFVISENTVSGSDEAFELSQKQKKILDERLKSDTKEFISARESLDNLRQKYEL